MELMGIGGEGSSWKENKKLDLFKRYIFSSEM